MAMLNNPNIGFFCERGSSFVEMNLKHNIFLLVETNTLNGFVSGFLCSGKAVGSVLKTAM